jgi:hypothetical protein
MTVSVMMLFVAATVLAAGINFSGTWVRDKDKSDPPMMGGRGGGGGQRPGGGGPGGGGGRAMADAQITLVLKQTDNELSLTRKITAGGQERPPVEQKFTLDGKENTNTSQRGELKSKSKWAKDKLVVEGTQKVTTPNGEFEMEIKDEYSLSADGKVLTVSTTRTTPGGEQTSKQVYNKQ